MKKLCGAFSSKKLPVEILIMATMERPHAVNTERSSMSPTANSFDSNSKELANFLDRIVHFKLQCIKTVAIFFCIILRVVSGVDVKF